LYISNASNQNNERRFAGSRFLKVFLLVTLGWLASARLARAEAGSPPAKAGGADAATPSVTTPAVASPVAEGPPSPILVPPPPPPGPSPEELALRAEQAQLKDTLDAIQAELGAEREQRAEEVIGLRDKADKAEAALKKVSDKPPVMTAHGGLSLTGYVQADWGIWNQMSEDQVNQSTLLPLNEERFSIRRARLRAALDKTYVAGALELDGNTVNGTTARLIGAEASAKLPGEEGAPLPLLMGTLGLFKIPFGYEIRESDRDRLFLERSAAERALFPGEYDLGARVQLAWRVFRLAFAVQNGEPLGEKGFPGRDPNAAKDFAGRAGVETPLTDSVTISAGVSGLEGKGFHRGTPATKATLQWNDRNEDGAFMTNELVVSPGVAATPSGNFDRFALGFDLELSVAIPHLGTAMAYGEAYVAKNLDRATLVADPLGPVGRDMREIGAYVAGIVELGDNATVGARYDLYNPDRDSTDPAKSLVPSDVSYGTLGLVAALHNHDGRLTLEYDHNTNHLGRDAVGNPASLKADTLTLRGQVSF
jgi:hypothetical protein